MMGTNEMRRRSSSSSQGEREEREGEMSRKKGDANNGNAGG